MTHLRFIPLLLTLWAVSFADDNEHKPDSAAKPPASTISNSTEESKNNATTTSTKMPYDFDGAMIYRALYVLIGVTAIGFLYFLVRAVRLKKTSVQRKKYGLLSNYDDTMEMAHLESDEDDTTVYEAKSLRR